MNPFFIIGAPRSGTTMLRDLFKQLDSLYSPEETHFFRWAAPFRGNEYNAVYENNKVLQMHRELDGVTDAEFWSVYSESNTRAEITDKYCELVSHKKGALSWFEKSPQNVYGLPLISRQMKHTQIIHIMRHPYDVVKSLLVGKIIKVDDVVGAANYWNDAIDIVEVCKPYLSSRLYTLKYEELVKYPIKELFGLERFLNIDMSKIEVAHVKSRDVDYYSILTREEMDVVNSICGLNMSLYGYEIL